MERSAILDAARYHIQMTPEEFLDWVDEDDKAELIDGEVSVASPALDGIKKLNCSWE